jgi:hypothetical protein
MPQGDLGSRAVARMEAANAEIEEPFREMRIQLGCSPEALAGLRIFLCAQKLQTLVELRFPAFRTIGPDSVTGWAQTSGAQTENQNNGHWFH